MYGYIYLTTNNVNGKKYIGQHRSEKFEPDRYLGSGILLIEAIDKYGRENFTCNILEECDSEDELNQREVFWIAHYNAVEDRNFYNICKGGEGHTCEPWNKGKHGVQEWTEKQEEAFEKGRHLPASDKLKKFLSEYRTNVVVSEDTRKKLSDAQKGKRCINNGIKNTYVHNSELDSYLNSGWKLGMDKTLVRK